MNYAFAIGLLCLTLAACGKEEAKQLSAAPEVDGSAANASTLLYKGIFEGRSDHITTGAVEIKKDDEKYYLVLGEDFSLDGAPAPTLGFGDGEFIAESEFSALREHTGKQSYKLPDDFNPSKYTEVYLWCSEFSVPLGVAALNAET